MSQEHITIESLEGGSLLERFNAALIEAGRILDRSPYTGQVTVTLKVQIKQDEDKAFCLAKSTIATSAGGLGKSESQLEVLLRNGQLLLPAIHQPQLPLGQPREV